MEKVNLFTKINSKNGIKLINNINQNYVNMASSFWSPWEHQEQETSTTGETENTLEISERGKPVKTRNKPLRAIEKTLKQEIVVKKWERGISKKAKLFFLR